MQSLATCVCVGVVMKRNMLMCACLLSWLVCVVIVIRGLLLVDCCCSVTGTTFSVHHVWGYGGEEGEGKTRVWARIIFTDTILYESAKRIHQSKFSQSYFCTCPSFCNLPSAHNKKYHRWIRSILFRFHSLSLHECFVCPCHFTSQVAMLCSACEALYPKGWSTWW